MKITIAGKKADSLSFRDFREFGVSNVPVPAASSSSCSAAVLPSEAEAAALAPTAPVAAAPSAAAPSVTPSAAAAMNSAGRTLYRGYIGIIVELYWLYIEIVMELYRGYTGIILGLYWDYIGYIGTLSIPFMWLMQQDEAKYNVRWRLGNYRSGRLTDELKEWVSKKVGRRLNG